MPNRAGARFFLLFIRFSLARTAWFWFLYIEYIYKIFSFLLLLLLLPCWPVGCFFHPIFPRAVKLVSKRVLNRGSSSIIIIVTHDKTWRMVELSSVSILSMGGLCFYVILLFFFFCFVESEYLRLIGKVMN